MKSLVEEINYIFIKMSVTDGERKHDVTSLKTTLSDNINEVAEEHASTFYGEKEEKVDGGYYACGGEVFVKVKKVTQVTKKEYLTLKKCIYA